jgi:hypothetical protein
MPLTAVSPSVHPSEDIASVRGDVVDLGAVEFIHSESLWSLVVAHESLGCQGRALTVSELIESPDPGDQ